ncbi:glycosyltransferase [Methylobacterium oryzae CBMB20]
MKKIEAVDPHYGRLAAIAEARLIGNAIARNGLRIAFPPVAVPDVSIVIVSLNARDLLTLTLYRLATQQAFAGASFEVIVVDNASDAETLTVLDLLDGATVIRNAENVGYGPACNQGAGAARGRYLLFLNPDVELMPGAIGALVSPFSDATVGIVGAHLVFPGAICRRAARSSAMMRRSPTPISVGIQIRFWQKARSSAKSAMSRALCSWSSAHSSRIWAASTTSSLRPISKTRTCASAATKPGDASSTSRGRARFISRTPRPGSRRRRSADRSQPGPLPRAAPVMAVPACGTAFR